MTLNKTWTLCLRMWRWISKHYEEGGKFEIDFLKKKWLAENGFADCHLDHNCFFCEYDDQQNSEHDMPYFCLKCPGIQIDSKFHCNTEDNGYDCYKNPKKFYKKLLELNRLRKNK